MASESKKVIIAALIGNGAISITKFIAAAMTGSAAMLTEGIHSLVDTGNQVLLLFGLSRSKRAASDKFPFGHGKEVYFWSFVVAILIFAVGAGLSIYEGIHHILHPVPVTNPMINYIVLGLAMIFEGVAWSYAFIGFRKAKGDLGYFEAVQKGKDPTLFVVLFEDSAAMLGLLVAFFGILLGQITGIAWLDGAAAVTIGLILAGTAIWLAIETKGLLIGEAANVHVIEGIRSLVGRVPEVSKVNEVLTMHMGPEFILLNLSIEFEDSTSSTDDFEQAVERIDRQIKQQYPLVKRIFIEAEASLKLSQTTAAAN